MISLGEMGTFIWGGSLMCQVICCAANDVDIMQRRPEYSREQPKGHPPSETYTVFLHLHLYSCTPPQPDVASHTGVFSPNSTKFKGPEAVFLNTGVIFKLCPPPHTKSFTSLRFFHVPKLKFTELIAECLLAAPISRTPTDLGLNARAHGRTQKKRDRGKVE